MATEFRCDKCGKVLVVAESAGTKVICSGCHNHVLVPGHSDRSPTSFSPPRTVVLDPTERPATPPTPAPGAIPYPPESDELEEGALSDRTVGILAALLPWGVSVVFHAGVFLILFFLFVAKGIVSDPDAERIIIPDARLSENPGGLIDPGKENTDLKTESVQRRTKAHEYQKQPTKDMLAEVNRVKPSDLKIIGIGVGAGGGPASAYRLSTGGEGDGPRASFYGSGGNAYKICYVIDRSGSLLDTFDYLRDALKKSLRDLVPQQQFHVIFFSAGKPEELPPAKLVYATPENKEKACKYLDGVVPGGQTQPEAALERAFACKPELIYFMTDGEFDPRVLDLLRRLNRDKKVKINTFSFLHKPGEELLKQIAGEHGGRYKHVSEDDLSE